MITTIRHTTQILKIDTDGWAAVYRNHTSFIYFRQCRLLLNNPMAPNCKRNSVILFLAAEIMFGVLGKQLSHIIEKGKKKCNNTRCFLSPSSILSGTFKEVVTEKVVTKEWAKINFYSSWTIKIGNVITVEEHSS